jgi:pimeloyl-ACP methyl ester carboxylesterase
MAQIKANGLTLEYEDFGDPAALPLLLIMGLGAQLTLWPMELVEALVERGFRVIRFDNRDIGLSQKMEGARAPSMVRHILLRRIGLRPRVPYTLADMAKDAVGLLDALGIGRAHIVGASMGGMIAQHIAFSSPERVLTLTSIMSTTGNPKLPPAQKAAIDVLTKRPQSLEEAVLVEHGVKIGAPSARPPTRPTRHGCARMPRAICAVLSIHPACRVSLLRSSMMAAGANAWRASRRRRWSFMARLIRWCRYPADRTRRSISLVPGSRSSPAWGMICRWLCWTRLPMRSPITQARLILH